MQYKFKIKNEEAQKCWQASREEKDTAENFRLGGESRGIELYLLRNVFITFEISVTT